MESSDKKFLEGVEEEPKNIGLLESLWGLEFEEWCLKNGNEPHLWFLELITGKWS